MDKIGNKDRTGGTVWRENMIGIAAVVEVTGQENIEYSESTIV